MDGERENVSVYVIKEGDNVDWIAETAGIPVGELLWANQIEYPYRLAVGQSLLIPEGPAAELLSKMETAHEASLERNK